MSSAGRNPNQQPLKPTLASTRPLRSPLTPRVAIKSSPTARSEPPTPRVRLNNTERPVKDTTPNGNITPRSSARQAKTDSTNTTPSQANSISSTAGIKSKVPTLHAGSGRNGTAEGVGAAGEQARPRLIRPKSVIGDSGSTGKSQAHTVHVQGSLNQNLSPANESIDSRFFHASDAQKLEPAPKKTEPKKSPAFFYADGQQEQDTGTSLPSNANSAVMSALSEQRSSGPWIRPEVTSNPSKSPPMLSPALSAISNSSPVFAATSTLQSRQRSPSPGKDNIHLSYRKGASQIFGMRPTPTPRTSNEGSSVGESQGRGRNLDQSSVLPSHRKSPSLSSIESSNSQQSRQKPVVTTEVGTSQLPPEQEVNVMAVSRVVPTLKDLPTIGTSLESPGPLSPGPLSPSLEKTLSPTKGVSELAAEARRERKVLDLEISNSSLMTVNASLEREVKRQKAELKRFRRLSRAGRLSSIPSDRASRFSDGLSTVGEGDEENPFAEFGPPSSLADLYDDVSDDDDDDDESLVSAGEPMSSSAQSRTESYRLAKDEKRLQVDLEKHKELLVQSQMMNQSIKRCMYATEDMIREGKKALDYHVRVSDVKLGGRVLSGHGDDDEEEQIEVEDEALQGDSVEQARGFLDTWAGVGRPSYESSDRDSGIEVDRPGYPSLPSAVPVSNADSGRPPGEFDEKQVLS